MNRILLVDDDALVLMALGKVLCGCGELVSVDNGADALRELRTATYDICFLDVNLPDANGLDIMKEAESLSPKTHIVIMTAADLARDQIKYLHEHAHPFLAKPFDLSTVRQLVSLLLTKDAPDPLSVSLMTI